MTLLNRVFDLPGVRVAGVDLGEVDGTGQGWYLRLASAHWHESESR